MAIISKLEDLFVSTITNSPAQILVLPQSFPRVNSFILTIFFNS